MVNNWYWCYCTCCQERKWTSQVCQKLSIILTFVSVFIFVKVVSILALPWAIKQPYKIYLFVYFFLASASVSFHFFAFHSCVVKFISVSYLFFFSNFPFYFFVDGCFWHGCPKHGNMPVNNAEFWFNKITRNKERDREVNRNLRARGWRVFRMWEHELVRMEETKLVARLKKLLQ